MELSNSIVHYAQFIVYLVDETIWTVDHIYNVCFLVSNFAHISLPFATSYPAQTCLSFHPRTTARLRQTLAERILNVCISENCQNPTLN